MTQNVASLTIHNNDASRIQCDDLRGHCSEPCLYLLRDWPVARWITSREPVLGTVLLVSVTLTLLGGAALATYVKVRIAAVQGGSDGSNA